ncbi:MAG TPA: M1 family metallopeptidase [Holophagaceae bacterium]|nr:M1 family metallopeptidase [Holophagaceae bacterium]
MKRALPLLLAAALPAFAGTPTQQPRPQDPEQDRSRAKDRPMPLGPLRATWAAPADPHSFANAAEVVVRHVDLDLTVDFGKKELSGAVTLRLSRIKPGADTVVLDTRDLAIGKAEASADGKTWTPTTFKLGDTDKVLGAPLRVSLPKGATRLRIHYRTTPGAGGLQWLEPAMTAGKKLPFLFSQSESIYARTWIPLQDSPAVRVTYNARIRTPKTVRAVMSADQKLGGPRTGDYRFRMEKPIPSYLIALAVGDLDFQPLGQRSGVFAEPSVLPKAAKELEDTEKMIAATEKLYGPYRWGRYDILVLPPSFPYGGMENPRLTFATPTILAGDKSLVSLISHELAHSWSGNLVTNAGWADVWLNEGFTTYVERRIVEAVYGREQADMQATLGRQTLDRLLATLPAGDTVLNLKLDGREPDDSLTEIPYEKGSLFLRTLEEKVGRARFDAFLRGYFDHFAFHSIHTADFEAYLKAHLDSGDMPVQAWIHEPGLPAGAAVPHAPAFDKVDGEIAAFLKDGKAESLPGKAWCTQEWLHFLRGLPADLSLDQMKALDAAWHLTDTGNAEVAHVWLLTAIRRGYEPANDRLAAYLIEIGRRKLITPLYAELAKTPEGKARALAIYAKARPGYHPLAQGSVDRLLGYKPN